MIQGVRPLLDRLPQRNVGRGGRPGDPLNLVFLGEDADLCRALRGAGWSDVPVGILAPFLAGLAELARGKPLGRFPPMNLYRLEGRKPDLQWALVTRALAARHHFRLWRTGLRDARGRPVWWGTGNYDLAVRWRDLSHVPDPDIDRERDFVAGTLRGSPWVESLEWVDAGLRREGANDKGYAFRTDGRLLAVALRASTRGASADGRARAPACSAPTNPAGWRAGPNNPSCRRHGANGTGPRGR